MPCSALLDVDGDELELVVLLDFFVSSLSTKYTLSSLGDECLRSQILQVLHCLALNVYQCMTTQ